MKKIAFLSLATLALSCAVRGMQSYGPSATSTSLSPAESHVPAQKNLTRYMRPLPAEKEKELLEFISRARPGRAPIKGDHWYEVVVPALTRPGQLPEVNNVEVGVLSKTAKMDPENAAKVLSVRINPMGSNELFMPFEDVQDIVKAFPNLGPITISANVNTDWLVRMAKKNAALRWRVHGIRCDALITGNLKRVLDSFPNIEKLELLPAYGGTVKVKATEHFSAADFKAISRLKGLKVLIIRDEFALTKKLLDAIIHANPRLEIIDVPTLWRSQEAPQLRHPQEAPQVRRSQDSRGPVAD